MNDSFDQYEPDDLLRRATCAVEINGVTMGTAWLAGYDGYDGILITAGHILGEKKDELSEVDVKFVNEQKQKTTTIHHEYDFNKGIDFAILKAHFSKISRKPLPLMGKQKVWGPFRLCGYGVTLQDQSFGTGTFLNSLPRNNRTEHSVFLLDSRHIGEPGYSGGAVYSDVNGAVVAIQTGATIKSEGAHRDTIVAMPLFRIFNLCKPEIVQKLNIVEREEANTALVNVADTKKGDMATYDFEKGDCSIFCLYGDSDILKDTLGQLKETYEQDKDCLFVAIDVQRAKGLNVAETLFEIVIQIAGFLLAKIPDPNHKLCICESISWLIRVRDNTAGQSAESFLDQLGRVGQLLIYEYFSAGVSHFYKKIVMGFVNFENAKTHGKKIRHFIFDGLKNAFGENLEILIFHGDHEKPDILRGSSTPSKQADIAFFHFRQSCDYMLLI